MTKPPPLGTGFGLVVPPSGATDLGLARKETVARRTPKVKEKYGVKVTTVGVGLGVGLGLGLGVTLGSPLIHHVSTTYPPVVEREEVGKGGGARVLPQGRAGQPHTSACPYHRDRPADQAGPLHFEMLNFYKTYT